MFIWNSSGEQVFSYFLPPNAGWHYHQSKVESNFIDEVDAVYTQVYNVVAMAEAWLDYNNIESLMVQTIQGEGQ